MSFSAIGARHVTARLIGAHVLIVLPYLVRTIMASLTQIDTTLEECARTLGARAVSVCLPPCDVAPSIPGRASSQACCSNSSWSFDNVSVSLFLTNVRTNTLPLAMLNYVEFNFDPSIAAIASMLVFFSLGSAVLLERLVGLKRVLGA